jgi:hypothetical protein
MIPRILRLAIGVGCLQALSAGAGEIIILQPVPKEGQVIQISPETSDRGSERALNKARRQAGKSTPGTTIILTDDSSAPGSVSDNAEESARSASEYVRPTPPPQAVGPGGTVILRSVPITDSDRARQRARAYVVPAAGPQAGVQRPRECGGSVNNQVGTVGDGAGANQGGVLETGSSNVNLQSYCR